MKTTSMKKLAAIGITAAMSFGMLTAQEPFSGFAENFFLSASAVSNIASGTYGDMTWRLESDGDLIIQLTGNQMPDFTSGGTPWFSYRNQIKRVSLPRNLRKIGKYAFCNLTALEQVYSSSGQPNASEFGYFPVTLETVGDYAFYNCSALKGSVGTELRFATDSTKLSNNLTIGRYAFRNCQHVQTINFYSQPGKTVTLKKSAFAFNEDLKNLNFDVDHVTLGQFAFYGCEDLARLCIDVDAAIDDSAFEETDYSVYAHAVGYTTGGTYDPYKGCAEKTTALVNKERVANHLNPLKTAFQLEMAAQIRAAEIAENYSQIRPDGTRFYTILQEAGIYSWSGVGENRARRYSTPGGVVNYWMNTAAFRDNILEPTVQYIGSGTVFGYDLPQHYYWEQLYLRTTQNLEGYTVIAH